MDRDQEIQLITRAQQGEVEAFMTLVKEYERPIYQLIYRLTRNREDAADLTQETMLKAFAALKNFKLKSSFHTWIHRIAVNLTLNHLKRNKGLESRTEYLDGSQNNELALERFPSPEESSMDEELSQKLEKAIEELPPIYKTAFTLVVFQGLTHSQAAAVLGCSESTISWKIHEARKMLKEKLKAYLGFMKEV
ncbi:MAG: RNA polymerase sigma factor [Candidatus Saccharicenans sp.]